MVSFSFNFALLSFGGNARAFGGEGREVLRWLQHKRGEKKRSVEKRCLISRCVLSLCVCKGCCLEASNNTVMKIERKRKMQHSGVGGVRTEM